MAPAEIWQGGTVVNVVKGNNLHIGTLNGEQILVEDNGRGCKITDRHGNGMRGLSPFGLSNSITLDGGEIVKSV